MTGEGAGEVDGRVGMRKDRPEKKNHNNMRQWVEERN